MEDATSSLSSFFKEEIMNLSFNLKLWGCEEKPADELYKPLSGEINIEGRGVEEEKRKTDG